MAGVALVTSERSCAPLLIIVPVVPMPPEVPVTSEANCVVGDDAGACGEDGLVRSAPSNAVGPALWPDTSTAAAPTP